MVPKKLYDTIVNNNCFFSCYDGVLPDSINNKTCNDTLWKMQNLTFGEGINQYDLYRKDYDNVKLTKMTDEERIR